MKTRNRDNQGGFALVTMVMILVAVLVIAMAGLLKWSIGGYRSTVNRVQRTRMLYAADAGLQFALAATKAAKTTIRQDRCNAISSSFAAVSQSVFPADIRLERFEVIAVTDRICRVVAAVADTNDTGNWVEVAHQINCKFFSLFDFGVYYDTDLEIHAARPFQFIGGAVHANGDIYISCFQNQTMKFDSTVTASGDILHMRKDGPWSSGGNVYFRDADGIFQPMKIYDSWLDSLHPFWEQGALLRWDGNVRSKVHGVEEIPIPIPGAVSNPHLIVELPLTNDTLDALESKYFYKATMKIMDDGYVYGTSNINGNLVDYRMGSIGSFSWLNTNSVFYNARQGYMINPLDIDIDAFNDWIKTSAPATFTNHPDYAGILYIARPDIEGRAVRLLNAAELPANLTAGLSVVTPNPMYTQGHINTINKKPCSLISDALTVLSPAWDDAKNDKKNKAPASECMMNAAIIAGHVPTTGELYSGGLENLCRFLENWSADNFIFNGAMINIWDSRQETVAVDGLKPDTTNYSSTYYVPPYRIWAYENMFANPGLLPPGTPIILNFYPSGWARLH